MRREYSFVKHEQDAKAKLKFAVTLLHRQIAENIYKREQEGISQTNVRKLLEELNGQKYPSIEARDLYERLLIEANTQLRLLALPKDYKVKHKEFTLKVAYKHFKQTYGVEPYHYLKQNWIQLEQERQGPVSQYASVVTGDRGHSYPKFGGEARQRRERKNPMTGKIEDHDRPETFLRSELNDPEQALIEEKIEKEIESSLQEQGFLPTYRQTFKEETGVTELQKVMREKREKIVLDSKGELVRMAELKLLKGAINTSGMLAGLPNYTVIPMKKEGKLDKSKLPSEEELSNMTPQKLLELEAQGTQVLHFSEDDLTMQLKHEEEDKVSELMSEMDLEGALNYMEQVTEKYKEMEIREAKDRGLEGAGQELKVTKMTHGPDSRKSMQQLQKERKEERQLAILDNLRINRIKKALSAGFEIDDPVYYEMLEVEPKWLKVKEQRQIRHARRLKIEDVDQAFIEVPLTRAEEEFLEYEDFLGQNERIMQEYQALERKIVARWDKEVQEQLEEDELDMEMLGRRFTKQGQIQDRKEVVGEERKRASNEETSTLEKEIYQMMKKVEGGKS